MGRLFLVQQSSFFVGEMSATVMLLPSTLQPEQRRAFQAFLFHSQQEQRWTELEATSFETGSATFLNSHITAHDIAIDKGLFWSQIKAKKQLFVRDSQVSVTFWKVVSRCRPLSTSEIGPLKVWIFQANDSSPPWSMIWCEKGNDAPTQ